MQGLARKLVHLRLAARYHTTKHMLFSASCVRNQCRIRNTDVADVVLQIGYLTTIQTKVGPRRSVLTSTRLHGGTLWQARFNNEVALLLSSFVAPSPLNQLHSPLLLQLGPAPTVLHRCSEIAPQAQKSSRKFCARWEGQQRVNVA